MAAMALFFVGFSMSFRHSVANYDYYSSQGAHPSYDYYNSVPKVSHSEMSKESSYAYYGSGSKDPASKMAHHVHHVIQWSDHVLRFADLPGAFPGSFPAGLPGYPGGFDGGIPGVLEGFPGTSESFPGVPGVFPGVPGVLPGLPGAMPGASGALPGIPGVPTGVNFPGQGVPGMNFPGQGVPGMNLPGQCVPDMNFPGQCVPGMNFPGQGVPGMNFPGQGIPGEGFPGQGVPGEVFFPGQGVPSDGFPGQFFGPGARDGRPGIPLTDEQHAVVQRAVAQAIEGLRTTIQVLEQHILQGVPIGDRFEQIFTEDISHDVTDESVIKERLGMVLDMMTERVNSVEFVYCPETDCKCDAAIGGCMIAYVVMFGQLGVEDQSGFTVHLGQLWWGLQDTWAEKCKAGNLIHEFTHHVFHTVDEGYNFQHKHLDDDQKKRNAAAYENLVNAVMMARERYEL